MTIVEAAQHLVDEFYQYRPPVHIKEVVSVHIDKDIREAIIIMNDGSTITATGLNYLFVYDEEYRENIARYNQR